MGYIEQTLGLYVKYELWQKAETMPYFITERYHIRKATIGETPVLFMTMLGAFPKIDALQKHIARIQKAEAIPVVLEMEAITKYRRDALIKAKIPFVVPDKQLYLPFLGAVLTERYDPEAAEIVKLIPSGQALFLYYLYSKKDRFFINDAVKDLQYSAMSVSRAAKQLVQIGLFAETKQGVQKILVAKHDREEMTRQIQPYLINPVKRRIYIPKDQVPAGCKLAGFSAMAEYSMLNAPAVPCYAVDASAKLKGMPTLINAENQAEIEVWKYDPAGLSKGAFVDPLSLTLTLQEKADERTEEAIEEILEKFWED